MWADSCSKPISFGAFTGQDQLAAWAWFQVIDKNFHDTRRTVLFIERFILKADVTQWYFLITESCTLMLSRNLFSLFFSFSPSGQQDLDELLMFLLFFSYGTTVRSLKQKGWVLVRFTGSLGIYRQGVLVAFSKQNLSFSAAPRRMSTFPLWKHKWCLHSGTVEGHGT